MTAQAISQGTQVLAEKSAKGFSPFRAISEGLRRRREHAETEALLDSCIRKGLGGGEDFKTALERFGGIGPRRQQKMLARVGRLMEDYSSCEFASERNSSALTVLSVFAAEAGALMPKDADGTPSLRKRGRLVGNLRAVLEQEEGFVPTNPVHANAKLAAAVALWEFGQRELPYWGAQLKFPMVRDFIVSKMLEDTGAGSFEGSGWDRLRKNLDTSLALSIAFNVSQRKYDFIASMMLDQDQSVVARALEAATYLNPLPAEFLDMAADAAARSEELNDCASCFISVVRMRPLLDAADDAQFLAAMHLLALYRDGFGHLGPLLVIAGLEMKDVYMDPSGETTETKALQQGKAAEVLRQMHASGITVPGVNFDEGKR